MTLEPFKEDLFHLEFGSQSCRSWGFYNFDFISLGRVYMRVWRVDLSGAMSCNCFNKPVIPADRAKAIKVYQRHNKKNAEVADSHEQAIE